MNDKLYHYTAKNNKKTSARPIIFLFHPKDDTLIGDGLSEAVGNGVPVEDIDPEGKLAVLKGLAKTIHRAEVDFLVRRDSQIKIGVLAGRAACAGTEHTHLSRWHPKGQDRSNDLHLLIGYVNHCAFRSPLTNVWLPAET